MAFLGHLGLNSTQLINAPALTLPALVVGFQVNKLKEAADLCTSCTFCHLCTWRQLGALGALDALYALDALEARLAKITESPEIKKN